MIFTLDEKLDGDSKRTAEFAKALGKPFIQMRPRVHPKFLASFLARNQVKILNVAGKRETSARGISDYVIKVLDQVLMNPVTDTET